MSFELTLGVGDQFWLTRGSVESLKTINALQRRGRAAHLIRALTMHNIIMGFEAEGQTMYQLRTLSDPEKITVCRDAIELNEDAVPFAIRFGTDAAEFLDFVEKTEKRSPVQTLNNAVTQYADFMQAHIEGTQFELERPGKSAMTIHLFDPI